MATPGKVIPLKPESANPIATPADASDATEPAQRYDRIVFTLLVHGHGHDAMTAGAKGGVGVQELRALRPVLTLSAGSAGLAASGRVLTGDASTPASSRAPRVRLPPAAVAAADLAHISATQPPERRRQLRSLPPRGDETPPFLPGGWS